MFLPIHPVYAFGFAACAAAKSRQSCPTLCDSIDGSLPGSSIPGILQARTLEWVAIWASLVAQRLKCLPATQETQVQSLGRGDPLEKEMATHSSILAWRIPWTEELGGLESTGCKELDTTERLHFNNIKY